MSSSNSLLLLEKKNFGTDVALDTFRHCHSSSICEHVLVKLCDKCGLSTNCKNFGHMYLSPPPPPTHTLKNDDVVYGRYLSQIMVSAPALAELMAALNPLGPPPTTKTEHLAKTGTCFGSSEKD